MIKLNMGIVCDMSRESAQTAVVQMLNHQWTASRYGTPSLLIRISQFSCSSAVLNTYESYSYQEEQGL